MIAIICAMTIEASKLITLLSKSKVTEILGKKVYTGYLDGKEVVIVISGIGKTSAGVTTALIIEHFSPTLIINSGVAGGYSKKLATMDIVVSDMVSYYDVDLSVDNEPLGKLPDLPKYFLSSIKVLETIEKLNFQTYKGLIITGDTFATNRQKLDDIVKKGFSNVEVLAVDMESAAIGQVSFQNNIPFVNIRVISDIIGEESQFSKYENFVDEATKRSINLIKNIINTSM